MRINSKPSCRAGRLLGACAVVGLAAGTSAYAQDCYDDTDLRWSTDHVYTIELVTMNRLNAVGASLRLDTTRRYMDGTAGPPFRKILDNLVH